MDLVKIALMFIGTPYIWAGNDVTTGVDCSGFVAEVMRSVGYLDKRDLNAQGIYNFLLHFGYGSGVQRNSVLFFGKSTSEISHVAIAIDTNLMVEAGGEGRENTDAGYVRVRPIQWRKDLVASLKIEGL